jgi:hypothetical protein
VPRREISIAQKINNYFVAASSSRALPPAALQFATNVSK